MNTETDDLLDEMASYVAGLWPRAKRKSKPSKRQSSRILARARRRQRKTGVPCTHTGKFVYELAVLSAPKVAVFGDDYFGDEWGFE